MIQPLKIIIVYPLLTLNNYQPSNNNIPYQPYTTTNMMQHHELKVYERFWDNIIKEEYNKILDDYKKSY